MKLGFILFDGMVTFDIFGFYGALTQLKAEDVTIGFVSTKRSVCDHRGIVVEANHLTNDLSSYDAIFVPGGLETTDGTHDHHFIDWFKTSEPVPLKVSFASGTLLLAFAGFVQNKVVAAHPKRRDWIRPYCAKVVSGKNLKDDQVITAGSDMSSVDLGYFFNQCLKEGNV